ncbi:hypothetical protein [Treponema phagedenis]|uniref:hypothetical protein n=1 Tax=Treponema phagedenis TaxID=162 RepID=UPI001652C0B8|nr:hypothetical protein [Treponema phagedenis]
MKRKILSVMVAGLFLSMLIMNCDSNGKKKMEEQQKKEKQRIEEEQLKKEEERKKEQQQQQKKEEQKKKTDLFFGKGGTAAANTDLAGKKFLDGVKSKVTIEFDKTTNLCRFLSQGFAELILPAPPVAEYTVNGNTITFDFTKHSTMMAHATVDDMRIFYKETIYKYMIGRGYKPEQLDTLWEEHLKEAEQKYGADFLPNLYQENQREYTKEYTEFLKHPQKYEGVISADKTKITMKKLIYPSFDHVDPYENVVFTKKQ